MNYRKFGKLGWQVSEISFGAWAIGGTQWGPQDDDESIRALHRALDLGINFIDTAQGYGNGHSEELIGRVLKERPGEEIYVATKVPLVEGLQWPPREDADSSTNFPAAYITRRCEESLKRLGRDYVDVYQFHTWASAFNTQDDWYEAMSRLKEQGKIRAVGVSVHDTMPDTVIGALALDRVDAVQVIYNIFEQTPEWNLFPVAERVGTAIIVRVPFDEGALTGKFTEDTTFPEGDVRRHYFRGRNLRSVVQRVEAIRAFKDQYHADLSMPAYALQFCLQHPAVSTVIPGIRNEEQAEMNAAASNGIAFPQAERAALKRFAWRKDFWNEEVEQ